MVNPNLEVEFCNFRCENPFLLGASPISRNGEMIEKAFQMGWGGAITKSVALEQDLKDCSLSPRFVNINNGGSNTEFNFKKIGMTNIDFRIDKSIKDTLDSFAKVKKKFPHKFLAVSIKSEYKEKNWKKLTTLAANTGADALELCLSCPDSGKDDFCCSRSKGYQNTEQSIGQNESAIKNVLSWVKAVTELPLIIKLSPNVNDIKKNVYVAKEGGARAVTATNSFKSISGFNLRTLEPLPTIEGISSVVGLTGPVLKPMVLYYVSEIRKEKNINLDISAAGGITCAHDSIEYLLVGANTLQIVTEVMWEGFGIIDELRDGLKRFMRYHNFRSVKDFIGIGNRKIKSSSKNLSRNQQLISNIDKEKCIGCGKCYVACSDGGYEAISFSQERVAEVILDKCVGCGLCQIVCPIHDAIYFTNKGSKERIINEG